MTPPDEAWYHQIHERLVARDVVAPAELAETLLVPLVSALRRKYANRRDADLVMDAVADALLDYSKKPQQFDPRKSRLFGFLRMVAERDLLNALAKRQRRTRKEKPLEIVELCRPARKEEGEAVRDLEGEDETSSVESRLCQLFADPTDLGIARLIVFGERSTTAYARLLRLEALPVEEQRKEVKRHKDRIKKQLQRSGVQSRE